ncbi:MAG: BON domain-containing protein [Acidobacteriota bacterium]|nr:BON domain-containing protein [Acidobacteriota bacterium]
MARKFSAWIGTIVLAAVCAGCAQSDAGITTKVKAKLETDRSVTSASNIQVVTNGKVVTLTGTAASDAEKVHVLQVAKSTEGVRDVVDQITVSSTSAVPAAGTDNGTNAPAPPSGGAPAATDLPPAASPTAARPAR